MNEETQMTVQQNTGANIVKKSGTTPLAIITRLDKQGEGSFLRMITSMTGDGIFAKKFVTYAKQNINKAWKLEGKRWVNPFSQIPEQSIIDAMVKCASRNILPDGYNAHLVPHLGKFPTCTLMVDYKGLVNCAIKEGAAQDIGAVIVRENDDIEISFGEVTRHTYDPRQTNEERGEIIGCIGWAILPGGYRKTVYVPKDELEHIRSKAKTDNIWSEWTEEMYKKTAIRRLFKTMINTPKLQALSDIDNESFELDSSKQRRKTPIRSVISSIPQSEQVEDEQEVDIEAETEPAPAEANEDAEEVF